MKTVFIILVLIILAGVALLFTLGFMSRSGNPIGLVAGKLAPCPNKPNCVNSEFPSDQNHYTEAFLITQASTSNSWQALQQAIIDLGGVIVQDDGQYLAATFQSKTFGFIDDFEARLDLEQQRIQIRSASRVGYSDRGVNRQRVAAIKQRSARLSVPPEPHTVRPDAERRPVLNASNAADP